MIVGVGHSLGNHVFGPITAAFERRRLGKIRLVWAICPATDGYINGPKLTGLNPKDADTVIHVYTDNLGPRIARGTNNYFINTNCTFQPLCKDKGCNHFACLTFVKAALDRKYIENKEAFIGERCYQEIPGCRTYYKTSKLGPSSVKQTGCYCLNVGSDPPYYRKPSEPVC